MKKPVSMEVSSKSILFLLQASFLVIIMFTVSEIHLANDSLNTIVGWSSCIIAQTDRSHMVELTWRVLLDLMRNA